MDFGCTLVFMPPNSNSNSREPNEHEHLLEQESGLTIPIIGRPALSGVGDRDGTFLLRRGMKWVRGARALYLRRHFQLSWILLVIYHPSATEVCCSLEAAAEYECCA